VTFATFSAQKPIFPFWNEQPFNPGQVISVGPQNPTSATYKICNEKVSNQLASASTTTLSGLLG
jgi:hypothetical protein